MRKAMIALCITGIILSLVAKNIASASWAACSLLLNLELLNLRK